MKSKITKDQIPNLLAAMVKEDQEAWKQHKENPQLLEDVVKKNQKLIIRIVKDFGLVSISKFGKEASHFAWLIIQHFPKANIKFMEEYLNMMKQAKEDISPRNLAYLSDRIQVYKGEKQIYGTQGYLSKNKKIWKFREIEDVKNIDKIRKSMGLDTLKEYAELMQDGEDYKVELPKNYE